MRAFRLTRWWRSRSGISPGFPSLELTCDGVRKAGNCDSGYSCAYEYNLAWRSPTQPVSPEPNPRLVFERLFGAGSREERQGKSQTPPAGTAFHPRFCAGGRERRAAQTQRTRPAEARPISDQRARNRAAHRKGGAHAGGESRRGRALRHPAELRGAHRAHVRHADAGVPDRFHARRHHAAGRRRQQPHLHRNRTFRGPSQSHASSQQPRDDRQGQRD